MSKPILCLDFDGVIHSYTSGWQGADVIPDPPVPGALWFILEALEHFDVQIFSSRNHQAGGILAMRHWLHRWLRTHDFESDAFGRADIPVFGMHDTMTVLARISFPTEKPPAFVGLDDRVMQFEGSFPSIEDLQNFKPWWKD